MHSDEAILDAALSTFARLGYDATSVRALNATLGLSHETISQRFGSKRELYRAAVRHGLSQFMSTLRKEVERVGPHTDLEHLRATVRSVIVATSLHPSLGELMHHEGISADERADLLETSGLTVYMADVSNLVSRLITSGTIRPTTLRELWFLAQGASAPLHFTEFAALFDPVDGPLDPDAHIERTTETIMRGLLQ